MSAVAPRRNGEPRDNQKPDGWERTRLGVVIPLCVVVAVAIVCIIVAALTSAHRADEVALENEKHLLTRAFANHGDWSLRRLRNIITHDSSYRGIDVDERMPTDGRSPDDCARFANAVASFAVEGVGMESLADRARVDARMR